ncbi:MAG: glycoside hydrolase family 99-like domain-containing protein [Oscillochloridaceae bacterium]|nr:glycoside hydrolase family 99-like domain-containing protein [Chloroflexaceae bacterium]MDW8390370.1 glycoside hydrolase family 99-like domain-containing protein [Oscillochloridaceae bacterium]
MPHHRYLHRIALMLIPAILAGLTLSPAAPARAAPERPIMAFYYPWWELSDWSYSRMSDLPAPRYSGGDEEAMRRHVQQADDAGIDALVCTWYGPDEDRLNKRCRRLIELAREGGRDLQVAIIPDHSAWGALRSIESLARAVDVLKRDFFSQPNYLRYQGRPVVFWFNPPALGDVGAWRELRNRADPGREQFWFGGTDNFGYLEIYDALYYFDISWERRPGAAMASYASRLEQWNRANGQNRPFVATVMPGYDDLRIRGGHARDRQNGEYYRSTWQTAIERNAQAVVLTSFNEFYEGSHIEPSERYGDLYLRLTRELSDRFRREVGQVALPPEPAPANCQTFPETGHQVCGRLLAYWRENGGLPVFGLPISPQRSVTIEGREVQAQEFERNRLELHPQNQRPYDVLLGRLGAEALARQGRDWQQFARVSGAPAGCLYFAETGHSLCEPFLSYFRGRGLEFDGRRGYSLAENLALFGLPLSEPQTETIEGRALTVQWFERARFEWHPDNPDPYRVLLGRLGAEGR